MKPVIESSDPFLRALVSNVSGFVSDLKATHCVKQ